LITLKNLPAFFKGDLDGKTIYISKRLSKEEKLFNILHLTGHTIQWNSNPKMFKLDRKMEEQRLSAFKAELHDMLSADTKADIKLKKIAEKI